MYKRQVGKLIEISLVSPLFLCCWFVALVAVLLLLLLLLPCSIALGVVLTATAVSSPVLFLQIAKMEFSAKASSGFSDEGEQRSTLL